MWWSRKDDKTSMRLPLHNLESIVCFNYPGVSPALMGACAERHIGLCFLKPSGQFLARVTGGVHGNIWLRRRQHELSRQEAASVSIARSILLGKIANSRKVIERALRDHALLVDVPALEAASQFLKDLPGRMFRLPTTSKPCAAWKGARPSSTSAFLADLVRTPSHPGIARQEERVAATLAAWLREHGVEAELDEAAPAARI